MVARRFVGGFVELANDFLEDVAHLGVGEPNERDEAKRPPSPSEQEAEEQAKLEALYLEQLRRRSCPVRWSNPKTKEEVTFYDFARSEGRFIKHFDKEGNPSKTMQFAQQDRLENWQLLQELAGLI